MNIWEMIGEYMVLRALEGASFATGFVAAIMVLLILYRWIVVRPKTGSDDS